MPVHINLTPGDFGKLKNFTLLKQQQKINEERKKEAKPAHNFDGDMKKDEQANDEPLTEEEIREQDRQQRRVMKILGAALFVAIAIPASTYLVNELAKLVKASKGLSDAFKG